MSVTFEERTLDPTDLSATPPTEITIYQPPDTSEVRNVCSVVPDHLITRDTTGGLARPTLDRLGENAFGGVSPSLERFATLGPNIRVDALWLPVVDGQPAVTVTPSETRVQTYSPVNAQGRVFTWTHPDVGIRIAPVVGAMVGPHVLGVVGVEADVNLPGEVWGRLGVGVAADPTDLAHRGGYVSVLVRPFTLLEF